MTINYLLIANIYLLPRLETILLVLQLNIPIFFINNINFENDFQLGLWFVDIYSFYV